MSSSPCTPSVDGVDDGYVHYETELRRGVRDAVHRVGHGPRPVGRDRRDRAGAVAVPVRHRPRRRRGGPIGATGQRPDPARAARRACLRDASDHRRAVGPPPRRRRRAHRPHVRSVLDDRHDRRDRPADRGQQRPVGDLGRAARDAPATRPTSSSTSARCRPRTWAASRGATSRRRGCCPSTSSPVDARTARRTLRASDPPATAARSSDRDLHSGATSAAARSAGLSDQGPEKTPSVTLSVRAR